MAFNLVRMSQADGSKVAFNARHVTSVRELPSKSAVVYFVDGTEAIIPKPVDDIAEAIEAAIRNDAGPG